MTEPLELTIQVSVGGLSVREWPGEGRPIVCLHGLASNARWWDPVADRLEPSHRVLAVDLRGHGRSERPDAGYGFPEVGGDVVQLLDHLGLSGAVLVGHSWGASVALWAAGQAASVAGVVCVDGGAVDLRAVFGPTWAEARERMRPPRPERLDEAKVRSHVAHSALSEEIGEGPAAAAIMGNFEVGPEGWLLPRLSMGHHMEIAEALYHLDQMALWRNVACPVRFLMAESGEVASKRAAVDIARRTLRGQSDAVFISGQHDLPIQRPGQVAAWVLDFAAGLPALT